jgi:uncharacterized protein YegP (UPF0339 family)
MRIQKYIDTQGYWRWRLIAANNRIIADSGEGYDDEDGCDHGIMLMINWARSL